MNPYRLCYFSATALEIPSLRRGLDLYLTDGGRVRVTARTNNQLFDEARIKAFVKDAMKSDAVIVVLHGGKASCAAFDALIAEFSDPKRNGSKAPYLHIKADVGDEEGLFLAGEYSAEFGTENWDIISSYVSYGGPVNFRQLFRFLGNIVADDDVGCVPPEPTPGEGIYHPDVAGVPSLDEYLKAKVDPSKITVGLWFYHSYWINNNLEHINALIKEVESRGANVIAVFHRRFKDESLGTRGADYVVDHFFMENGTPRIDALINPMNFSLSLFSPEYEGLLERLDVPVIQALTTSQPYEVWKAGVQGMSSMEVSYAAAQPEFDGALISVPVSTREENETDPFTGALLSRMVPIPDRVRKVVSLALNWAKLRKKSPDGKKIAVIFHNYPPRNDRIGCAAGLDSFESVKLLLDRMKEQGYVVEQTYENGDELAQEMVERMTCDQRWLTPERMSEKAEARAGREGYLPWHAALPDGVRSKMREDWGEVPGDLFVYRDEMMFPGMINGNIFLTIQPPRGYLENVDKIYHDLYLSPPHHYLAQYRWIRDVFRADAVMHVGKHGSLEWLPGKALGLSEECFPDLSIMDLPNVYPYIINDPSEGTQAKRRSYCCIIDHLTPVFSNADLYEDLTQVESALKDYEDAVRENPGKLDVLRPMLWEAVVKADLDKDLEMNEESAFADFEKFREQLHGYLSELRDTMINDGLHIMGTAPRDDRLVEFLTQLTRLPNGAVPSLREALVAYKGYDYDELLENRGSRFAGSGDKTGGMLIGEVHELALELVGGLSSEDYDPERASAAVESVLGRSVPEVLEIADYICRNLVPDIRRVSDEIDASLRAFQGRFVPPGPSGAPTRGQADILPTGRNFFSVDPSKIPTPGAWEVGIRLGDALIDRCLQENGEYPEGIGIVLWGGATMRSKGDDLAEILYLMGVKPVWQKGSGRVTGVEVIPVSELKRPRLDVTPRISGFFRDAFPNLVELMDDAVRMVAALKEPFECNMLRRNVLRDVESYRSQGLNGEDAFREATFRIFGCPPGTYGAGVEELIESKNWKTQDDLADNYIRYSAHAYGRNSYGKHNPETFRRVLSRMEVTVKNEDSREYDMLSCTDFYNYYGGLIAAAKSVRGELPFALAGDASDPGRILMRTTMEETKHVLRARLVNPKWLEGMKRHGFKGAGDISKMMDVVLGWDATAEVMEDWMYERMAQQYALDPDMRQWMKEVNPYALQNILDKLLEAISRGMWNAGDEMEAELRNAYLEIEGQIEEITE